LCCATNFCVEAFSQKKDTVTKIVKAERKKDRNPNISVPKDLAKNI
jgi:hypothetical protein